MIPRGSTNTGQDRYALRLKPIAEDGRVLCEAVFLEIDQVEVGFDFLLGRGADGAALLKGGNLLGRIGFAVDDLVVEIGDGVVARPRGTETFLKGVDDTFVGWIFRDDLLEDGAFEAEEIEESLVVAVGEIIVAGKFSRGKKPGPCRPMRARW